MAFNPNAGTFSGSSDVALTGVADSQLIGYDSSSGKWTNRVPAIAAVSGLETALDTKLASTVVAFDSLSSQPDGIYLVADTPNPIVTYLGRFHSSADVLEGFIAMQTSAEVGDVIVASVHCEGSSADPYVYDSKGNTWYAGVTNGYTASGPASKTRMFATVVTSAMMGSDTVTVGTFPAGGLGGHAVLIKGDHGSTFSSTGATDTASAVNFPATVADSYDVIVHAVTIESSVTLGAVSEAYQVGVSGVLVGADGSRRTLMCVSVPTTATAIVPSVLGDSSSAYSSSSLKVAR